MRLLSLLALGLLLAGCADAPPTATTAPEGPAVAEPALPVPEETADRTKRLLQLEQACDQWYVAQREQEYARMDSLATLLRDYTNQHFEQIVSDLQFGSPRYQKMMAAALGFSGRQDAVPHLLTALRHPQPEVVLHALLSLYNLAEPKKKGDTSAPIVIDPEALIPYLAHPSEGIRSNASLALTRIVGPGCSKSVLLALIGTASDTDPATRVHAVAALGASQDKEAMPHLVKALSDPVQLVRLRAALGLGRVGDPAIAPYLVEVLRKTDESRDVKAAAARSLSHLLQVAGDPSLDPGVWDARLAATTGH